MAGGLLWADGIGYLDTLGSQPVAAINVGLYIAEPRESLDRAGVGVGDSYRRFPASDREQQVQLVINEMMVPHVRHGGMKRHERE